MLIWKSPLQILGKYFNLLLMSVSRSLATCELKLGYHQEIIQKQVWHLLVGTRLCEDTSGEWEMGKWENGKSDCNNKAVSKFLSVDCFMLAHLPTCIQSFLAIYIINSSFFWITKDWTISNIPLHYLISLVLYQVLITLSGMIEVMFIHNNYV